MTKKSTKPSTDKGRKRVAVKDLPKPTRELSSKEIKQVRGGTVVRDSAEASFAKNVKI